MNTFEVKRCYACGGLLPASVFHRNRSKADGLADACKPCRLEKAAAYRSSHHEQTKASVRAWQQRPENRKRRIAYMRDYQKRPEVKRKHRARNAVKDALLSGRLLRPDGCSRCGNKPRSLDLHAHHADYSKPLDVEWLCRDCHEALDS